MLSIGKPVERENAQATLAWEMAEQLKRADAGVFANVTLKHGQELYSASRSKSAIVVQKLSATAKEEDVVKFYLDSYSVKATVHAETMEKMYGHFSIFLSSHPFAACILYVRERKGGPANVMCIVSGRDRPSYIFSPRSGTLEKSQYLYGTMLHLAPAGSILSGYMVSATAAPVVVMEPKEEKASVPVSPKKKSPKKALLQEEEEEEEEEEKKPKKKTSQKKKRIKKETVEEAEPEKEEEDAEEKPSPKKKRIKKETPQEAQPSEAESSSKKETPQEAEPEKEEKPKKKIIRRAKLGKESKEEKASNE